MLEMPESPATPAPGQDAGSQGEGPKVEAHAVFRFLVDIGNGQAVFSECTLPSLEVEVTEQKEGGYNTGVHLLPGPVKAGRLTLKRGLTKSSELLKWYGQVASGDVKKATCNVTLTMLDQELNPVLRMSFVNAYPVKWSGPTFRLSDSTIAIESLELAFAEVQVE